LQGLAIDFRLPVEWGSFTQQRRNEFITNVRQRWRHICQKHGRHAGFIVYDGFFHLGFWHMDLFQDRRTRR